MNSNNRQTVAALIKPEVQSSVMAITGFTLVELLVVIAVISVLAALLLPALSAAKAKAFAVACTSNFKQFGAAVQLYAGDHSDHLLPNKGGQRVALGETWVEGWLGVPGPDCTNALYLSQSLLGQYLGGGEVWRCPVRQDPNVVGVAMPRVRTVSMNHFMGAPWNDPRATTYRLLSQITRPSPSDAFIFIDERIDTINDGAFALQLEFDERQPQEWMLLDKPGIAHKMSCNFAFAGGHAGLHRWQDARTLNARRDDVVLAGNPDVLWLEQHATWRQSAQP